MEILFIVLKIIGIVLLIILALFLFLILSVVFFPVRYRVRGCAESPGSIAGNVVFGWFFHLIHCKIVFTEAEASFTLRIAGIPINLMKEKKPPRQKKRFQKCKKRKKKPQAGQISGEVSGFGSESMEPVPVPIRDEPLLEPEDVGKSSISSSEKYFKQQEKRRNTTIFRKFISGIKILFQKIRRFLNRLKTRTFTLKERFYDIKSILSEETNKNAVLCLWRELKFLLRHYSPQKASGRIAYGTEDPALTGQVLGGASLFPFWHRYRISIEPDFYSDTFYVNGEIQLRGHIRAFHFLCSGIRLIKNKDIRKLINQIRN